MMMQKKTKKKEKEYTVEDADGAEEDKEEGEGVYSRK